MTTISIIILFCGGLSMFSIGLYTFLVKNAKPDPHEEELLRSMGVKVVEEGKSVRRVA